MNFLELAKTVRALVSEAEDGELTGPLEQALEQASGTLHDKHDAIRAVMNELRGRADRRKAEADRIAELARRAMAHHDRLRDWLMVGMKAAGLQRIETDQFVTSIVRNGGKAKVIFDGDPVDLPEAFRRVETTYSIDGDAVRMAAAAGQELPAGVKVERGERLNLK
jgi:hypothetical protein